MKKLNVLAISAAVAASGLVSGTAHAGLSANVGFMSDYYFRGVKQNDATASAGLDYEHESGLYVGTWAAEVGGHSTTPSQSDGIEIDLYGGYSGTAGDFSYGLGFANYQYTGDFDTSYLEVSLTAGYGPVSFEFTSGTREENPTDEDYTFMALSYEYDIVTATYGVWGDDFEGAYLEVGIAKEFSGIDFGVSIINGDAEENPSAGSQNFASDGTAMVFTIGKTFDL